LRVFVSYRRSTGRWVARALRQALEARDIEVFLDVEDIDSGRFESIILNQIGSCEHFILLLDEPTMIGLGSSGDWVGRELDRALMFGKNVVPVLVDGSSLNSVSLSFMRRRELLELNALPLPEALFDQAVNVLVERFLKQPALQEVRRRTAEEHYNRGLQKLDRKGWAAAESEFEQAVAAHARPEYLQGRATARYKQDKILTALADLDAAISMDPFASELMKQKFDLLQNIDRLSEALTLVTAWQAQAEERAETFARRITSRLESGENVETAVRSVPELDRLYSDMPEYEAVGSSLACLVEHLSGPLQKRLHDELTSWTQAHGATGP
jgi:tetratricopeptide (TPR) repeat protein